jgi:hypothetical protein
MQNEIDQVTVFAQVYARARPQDKLQIVKVCTTACFFKIASAAMSISGLSAAVVHTISLYPLPIHVGCG